MEPTILSVASRALVEAFAKLGLDEKKLLADCGLKKDQLFDADARIPASKADTLWQNAYMASQNPLLALHAAEALPFGAYRVLDYLAATADTIGEGLASVADYFSLVDARGKFSISTHGAGKFLAFEAADSTISLPQPAQEFSLAAIILRSNESAGSNWRPSTIHFTFPKPADISEHQRIFQCKLVFNAKTAGLTIPNPIWQLKSTGANPDLRAVLEQHARILFEQNVPNPDDLVETVKTNVKKTLNQGLPAIDSIAKTMGLGSKTLQRRLKDQNTTFAEVLDTVRFQQAKRYLADHSIAIAEVSWLLGFSEQSSFTRAFKRWTGASPAKWRKVVWTD